MKKITSLFIAITIIGWSGCSTSPVRTADSYKANKLFLKAVTIDTDETPSLPVTQIQISSQNIRPGYYIVQFQEPITGAMKQSLVQSGMQILNYLPENAFVIKVADTSDLVKLGSVSSIKWLGLYKSQYKVSPAFNNPVPSYAGAVITVTVQVFLSGDVQSVIDAIRSASGNIITMSVSSTGSFIRAQIPISQINIIADIPDVQWIEPYIPPKLMNNVATDIIGASNNWEASITWSWPYGVWSYGFKGTSQAIAIADTGLDIGNSGNNFTYNAVLGDYESDNITAPFHPAFFGKTIHIYALGRPNDFSDPNGHGTHVACSALGYDTQTSIHIPYWGSAYGMNDMVFMSIMDSDGGLSGIPTDLNTLLGQEYTDTLSPRIASNSWGAPVNGAYDAMAEQVDTFLWEHPDMVILFAAGNSGIDADGDGIVDLGSMASPATAKDLIAVGASESIENPALTYGDFGFTTYPFISDWVDNNINGMAAFSSRGPTLDGRIKPDIVSPGTAIASARSHQWLFNDDFQNGAGKWTSTTNTWQLYTDITGNSYEGVVSNGTYFTGTLYPINPIDIRTAMGNAYLFFNLNFKLTYSDNFTIYYYDADNSAYFPIYSFQPPFGGIGIDWAPVYYSFYIHNQAIHYNSANNYAMTLSQAQGFNFALQFTSASTPTGTGYMYIDNVRVAPNGWGTLGLTNGFVAYGSPEDENYIYNGGTSMATPLAAGAAADVRQGIVQAGISDPSAALIKAALINGTVDMYPGQYEYPLDAGKYQEEPTIAPNNVEGFGRVNLVNSLITSTTRKIYMLDYTTGNGLTTGGMKISYVTVNNNSDPLKMTLAWTDYPSTPSASVNIVNVLHFSMATTKNSIVYPNSQSTYDDINNVQQITVPSPQTGVYTVYISGYNVPQGTTTADDQPYALVISGDIKNLSTDKPSTISVTPVSVHFTATAGSNRDVTQNVSISNTGLEGSALTWTAQTANATWLKTSASNGTAPSSIVVMASAENLSTGTYTGNITFTADNATNSPVALPVTLTVVPPSKSSNGCNCSTSGQGNPGDIAPLLLLIIGFLLIKISSHMSME